MSAPPQLRFPLARAPSRAAADFVVSAANREAVALIDAWPAWPGGAAALAGPPGAGKSHLAAIWSERTGALRLTSAEDLSDIRGPLLVENAAGLIDLALFELINRAGRGEISLLLVDRNPPRAWGRRALPDLESRLKSIPVGALGEPDDEILRGALANLFAARLIRPAPDLYPYLLARMERSVPAASELVERLDAAGALKGREINRALAREILADLQKTVMNDGDDLAHDRPNPEKAP